MSVYTVMRNPSTVWMNRVSKLNDRQVLLLYLPGLGLRISQLKEKKNQITLAFVLCSFFFPLSLHRCFLPHLWCACVVCIFKVCKRRCLKKKMRAAMQLHAFPCDATLVHRGALSLDTNAEISCPHPLPSLTTSCNVIYKPSSSRVSLSFFFFFIHRSLTRVVQRTKGLLVYRFSVECMLLLFFSRGESAFSPCSFLFYSLASVSWLVGRAVTAWQFFFFFMCVCACACVCSCYYCQLSVADTRLVHLDASALSPTQPTSARMHALLFFFFFRF